MQPTRGEEYGSKVVANMFDNGIDVLEYENKDEADKQLFLKEFVNRIFMGDLPFWFWLFHVKQNVKC